MGPTSLYSPQSTRAPSKVKERGSHSNGLEVTSPRKETGRDRGKNTGGGGGNWHGESNGQRGGREREAENSNSPPLLALVFFPFALSCLFSTLDRKGLLQFESILSISTAGDRGPGQRSRPPLPPSSPASQVGKASPLEALKLTYISNLSLTVHHPVLLFTRCLRKKGRGVGVQRAKELVRLSSLPPLPGLLFLSLSL